MYAKLYKIGFAKDIYGLSNTQKSYVTCFPADKGIMMDYWSFSDIDVMLTSLCLCLLFKIKRKSANGMKCLKTFKVDITYYGGLNYPHV